MKRTFKRILPILLAAVTIASIVWYLFVYDKTFTRDLLVSGARFFDEQGNHSIAAWLYDSAYRQSKENDAVAIELAERFQDMGNFTKAENTLTGAIADGASAELYIALSETYVKQDKLLDAVAMLDSIADEEIREQINALRPAAPTVDAQPGFYNQYLPIVITSGGGKLYVTTNGEYPSVADAPSDGNLTLNSGENTIYALSVADNGLVSTLSIFGYTVSGVIEPITLVDPAIDAIVRQKLNVGSTVQLQSSQLWTITSLELPEGAGTYEDLARLPYLETLTIQGGTAKSLNGLGGLTQLKELTVKNCNVTATDLLLIAGLPKLEKLTLSGCGLSGIRNLSGAPALTHLNLSQNAISDIAVLSYMSGLVSLDLSHNALSSLNALSALSALETLDISYNNTIASLVPLAACANLKTLNASNNALTGLSGLEALSSLTSLDVSFNSLTELAPLAGCTALTKLDVSSNAIADLAPLVSLKQLQSFYFSRNEVSVLPDWGKSCALVTIDGSHNKLRSVSTLGGYENLNYVLMDYNKISNVNALAQCHNLIKVSVFGNPVKDVSKLTDMSIIVNYNPL